MKKTIFFVLLACLMGFSVNFAQETDALEDAFYQDTEETVSNDTAEAEGYLTQFDWETGGETQVVDETPGPSPFWSVVKVIFFTALFGFLAYYLIRLIVKKSGVKESEESGIIETIVTQSVGMGNYLVITKVGPSFYLMSLSGNDGLRMIEKIEDKETIDYLELHKDEMKPKSNQKFIDLMTLVPGFKKGNKVDYMKKQKDKLTKM